VKNKILSCSLLLTTFTLTTSGTIFASDTLTKLHWPDKRTNSTTGCKNSNCSFVSAYNYHISLNSKISKVVMLEGLGLEVTTSPTNKIKSKTFSFSIPHESFLPSIKEKFKHINITINSWVDYHELLAKKSSNEKIESLREALDVTKAKHYYKYESKKAIDTSAGKLSGKTPTPFTAFFVEQIDPVFSYIIIIPDNSKVKPTSLSSNSFDVLPVLIIQGKSILKTDVELILSNL